MGRREMTLDMFGLRAPDSWLATVGLASAGVAVMFLYTPLADRIATRMFDKPPTLELFRAIQQSRAKLIAGIAIAWLLGGFLEELIFRGIVLQSVRSAFATSVGEGLAVAMTVCGAALGAGALHWYQGARAVAIITQLSVLLGILFVLSGYNLWTVILCHGFYDTIAFVRFANKTSKYSVQPHS